MMRIPCRPAAVCFLLYLVPASAYAQPSIDNWLRWEQTLTTTRDYHLNNGNPYRDLVLRVTYTPTSCDAPVPCVAFTGYGFWDGGRTFRIRSAFPAGTWSWKVTCGGVANGLDCSTDPALDSVLGGTQTTTSAQGAVTVFASVPGVSPSDPYRNQIPLRGFVRISSDNRYLTYADGVSKIFWQGDTAWSATLKDLGNNVNWDRFLDDRVSRGFTVVMTAIAPDHDNSVTAQQTVFEDVGGNCLGSTWPKSCSRWRPTYFQYLDEKIKRANEKGLLVVLVGVMDPMGNASNSNPPYPRPEDAAVFARNLAARLSGSHVIFSPSFDDLVNVTTTPLLTAVGCALRDATSRHLVTAHLGGGSSTSVYQTVHNERWHQLHVFHSGHAFSSSGRNPWEDRYEHAVRRARTLPETLRTMQRTSLPPACTINASISSPSTKPNVNGEAAYANVLTTPTYFILNSQEVDTPQGVRHTGYYSTLNGAFGFTLGVKGIWDWTDVSTTWLDSEGSRHMKILGDQFRLQPWESIVWWSSLVKNQRTEIYQGQTRTEEDKQVVVAATGDKNYVLLFAPDNAEVKVDLSGFFGLTCDPASPDFNKWTKTWIDPDTGLPGTIQGSCQNISETSGATRKFSQPSCPDPFQGDSGKCEWIIKLQRTSSKALSVGQTAGLDVWPEPGPDGRGWRIMGRRWRLGEAVPAPFTMSEPEQDGRLLKNPVVAHDAQGMALVVWEGEFDGHLHGIFSRRIDAQGRLLDRQYLVNLTQEFDQTNPWAAASPAGEGVITWTSFAQDGELGGIFARLVNPAGVPFGQEISVNENPLGHQDFSKVGLDAAGNFVVAWTSRGQDGDAEGIYARRFDRRGNPSGREFQVNTAPAGAQFLTTLEVGALGNFLIIWASYEADGKDKGVFGRRYDANGLPMGAEFMLAPPREEEPNP